MCEVAICSSLNPTWIQISISKFLSFTKSSDASSFVCWWCSWQLMMPCVHDWCVEFGSIIKGKLGLKMGVWVSIHHVLSYPKSLRTTQAPSQIYPRGIIASGLTGFWMGQPTPPHPTALLIPSIISHGCSAKGGPHITKCWSLRLFNALPIQCKCVWVNETSWYNLFANMEEWFTLHLFHIYMTINQTLYIYIYIKLWLIIDNLGSGGGMNWNCRALHLWVYSSQGDSQMKICNWWLMCTWYIHFNYRGREAKGE